MNSMVIFHSSVDVETEGNTALHALVPRLTSKRSKTPVASGAGFEDLSRFVAAYRISECRIVFNKHNWGPHIHYHVPLLQSLEYISLL